MGKRGARGVRVLAAVFAATLVGAWGVTGLAQPRGSARTEIAITETTERINLTGEAYLEQAIGLGANALFMGLGREDEIEADTIGMRMASDTGYDRAGLERFVTRLEERSNDESLSLLEKTHPDPDDRLDALRDAMRRIPNDRAGRVVAADRFNRATGRASP